MRCFKQYHGLRKQCTPIFKWRIRFLYSVCHFLYRAEYLLCLPIQYLSAECYELLGFALDFRFQFLHSPLQPCLLLLQMLFTCKKPFFLFVNITLNTGNLQFLAARILLRYFFAQRYDLLLCFFKFGSTTFLFQLMSVDVRLCQFFFCPLNQKRLHTPALYRLVHFLVQSADLLQRRQLFLLSLCQLFMPLIIPDVLLHQLNIRLFWNITDVLCNKFLNIYDRLERNGLFHHTQCLLIMDVPLCKHIAAVFFLCIIKFYVRIVFLQEAAQIRDFHRFSLLNIAVSRNHACIDEEKVSSAAITAAIKHHSCNKAAALCVVLKFANDVSGEVFSPPGIGVIFIHISAQITVKCSLRLFTCSLIEIARVGLAQKNDLKCINDRGFSGAVFSRQKVDVTYFNKLLAEVQPVNQ